MHDKFIDAVESLGGYHLATPMAILKSMGIDKLELGHVKSHLQKYRTEKKRTEERDERDKKSSSQKKVQARCLPGFGIMTFNPRSERKF